MLLDLSKLVIQSNLGRQHKINKPRKGLFIVRGAESSMEQEHKPTLQVVFF
jgi:hypothetical protein